jgi:hypothetical protein
MTAPEPTSKRDHRTESILLVADSQYHELYGAPTFLQSAYADQHVEVALRPAQQRMYGDELFAYALEQGAATTDLVIHLGDALDVSCKSEWERFEQTMALSDGPWLMVPGNHDGFFTGNLSPGTGDSGLFVTDAYGNTGWCYRCSPRYEQCPLAREADPYVFGKDKFIRSYLLHLGVYPDSQVSEELPASGERTLAFESLPVRVAWSIDRDAPWRSFILQEVRLPSDCAPGELCDPVVLYLVDTNQPEKRPKFPFRPVGLEGALGRDQVEILRRWSGQVAESTGAFLIAGHHPLDAVEAARRDLEVILRGSETPFYISAHTHAGYWKIHEYADDDSIVELNVGSILDWPVEYRTFRVEKRDGVPGRIESDRITLKARSDPSAQSNQTNLVCEGTWKFADDDPLDVSKQQPDLGLGDYSWIVGEQAQIQRARETLRSALRTELMQLQHEHEKVTSQADDIGAIVAEARRLAEGEPLDNMTRVAPQTLLRRIQAEDDWRTTPTNVRRYRVCQALWASEADWDRQVESSWRKGKPKQGTLDPNLRECTARACV